MSIRDSRLLHCLFLIRQRIEGLTHFGKDWTLMLQYHLILSLEVFCEYWIQRLTNQDHRHLLYVRVFDFQFNLKTFKRFNMGTLPFGPATAVINWPKRPGRATLSSVASLEVCI